ncbi:MAG TPA: TRAP transporter substrate-binding protein DctP [Peptococcaceae bacterium]|nr:TRAP transporter substrate-binding protein DctP [Peptococcaceae bacterium]HQD53703.1 TRAP transporter substrate-binding protein DctP [Peptococcaceae bacterium]
MKKLRILLVLVMLGALFVGCTGGNTGDTGNAGSGEQTYQWKFVHEEAPGSMQDHYAQEFKRIIEEKSSGRIKVDIFPVGQLGDGSNLVELLQNGAVEFGINCPGATATIVPETNVFNTHFLLPGDTQKAREVLKTSPTIKEYINSAYYAQNMQVLDWFCEGYMMWTADREIRKPADMKGFKIRTMASPMIAAMYEAYGANPTPVPYMEVYSSLQLKMIDGQVNPLFAIEEMKFYEVQDYLILSKQDVFVATFCANKKYWEALPEDVKKLVTDSVEEVNEYIHEVADDLNNDRLEKMKANSDIKVIELTEEEIDAFRQASMPARDKFLELGGPNAKAIMDGLVKDVEAVMSKA